MNFAVRRRITPPLPSASVHRSLSRPDHPDFVWKPDPWGCRLHPSANIDLWPICGQIRLSMSRSSNRMRQALQRSWIPAMREIGFTGQTATFRRLNADSQDLLTLQTWKHGGQFILEFARRERGPAKWGDLTIPEEKMDVAYVDTSFRARLLRPGPIVPPDYFHGFDYSGFGEDQDRYDALAQSLALLVPAVDAWLHSRARHPQIRSLDATDV